MALCGKANITNMIPIFPRFREISIADRAEFSAAIAEHPPGISELTFTNLYVWRHFYQPRLSRLDDFILVRVRMKGHDSFLAPIGPGLSLLPYEAAAGLLASEGHAPFFERIPQPHADLLLSCKDRYTISPDRDNFDYLYLREELALLPGRRFMDKRNHAHQFERKYHYDFTKLSAEHLPGCLALLNTWCELRHCAEDMGLSGEERAIQEAIGHFEELAVTGGAILLNGQVQAFSLGEPLSADTVVIHFEKGNSEIPGIYQAINRDFCRIAWAGFQFINREQDLGVPGLRRAKESYNPVRLVPKYQVRVNIPSSSDQSCKLDLEPVR